MEVNVCFLTDEGYAMPTCVAINSMLLNKNKNTVYNVYLLCMNITDSTIEKFQDLNHDDFKINIVKLDNKYEGFNMEGVSASPTAIYKFNIPEILKDIDKIIYLDGDIIIKSDLSELFGYDIKDNYVGVVKDINGLLKRHFSVFLKKNIFYFNSGVMLMNLKKMRDNKITDKLIDYRINGYNELMDQDALNYIFMGQTYELPFKYNTQTMMININKNITQLNKLLNFSETIKEYDDLVDESTILHYSLKSKPWKAQSGYMFDLWMYYYYLSPYKEKIIIRKRFNNLKNSTVVLKIKAVLKNYRRYKFFMKFGRI